MYNGQGESSDSETVPGAFVRADTNNNERDSEAIPAEERAETGVEVSKVKVVTPDVAAGGASNARSRGSVNSPTERQDKGPDTFAHSEATVTFEVAAGGEPAAKSKELGPSPMDERAKPWPDTLTHREPKRAQQRVEDPRHWLEVTANNLRDSEVVAKRKALEKELVGEEAAKPVKIRGLMCPRMRALEHPAAPLLKEYAIQGCPVKNVGRDWTLEELEAAVKKGLRSSALEPDAIEQIQIEAREKVKQGFAKIYTWEWLKRTYTNTPRLNSHH